MTENVGGGVIGSWLYGIFYQLLGHVGTIALSLLTLISGILMFFDVKFRTLVAYFQKFSQAFIKESRTGAGQIKEKYQEQRELFKERRQRERDNREKLTDPWQEPASNDSQAEAGKTEAERSVEKQPAVQPEPASERPLPEIQVAEQHPDEDAKKAEPEEKAPAPHLPLYDDNYEYPPLTLLKSVKASDQSQDKNLIGHNTQLLETTFKSFGVDVMLKRRSWDQPSPAMRSSRPSGSRCPGSST